MLSLMKMRSSDNDITIPDTVAFVAEWLRRYVQVVVNFVGAGSSPVECKTIFVLFLVLEFEHMYVFGLCSWLSRQSNTLKVPSSILGSNMF